ncbi:hypothetical protein ACFRCG_39720 [Embleya sp. NPDC056575]|uniref:hypothetical protein n=1 Tax=unclassified Embleya TaxID=2699296 RepID=UPI0036C6D2E4
MIPPAALSAIDTAGDTWLAHPNEGPLSAAVAAALADYDVKPATRPGSGPRATCPECGRDWAITIAGHLRQHRNAMRQPCSGGGRPATTGRPADPTTETS